MPWSSLKTSVALTAISPISVSVLFTFGFDLSPKNKSNLKVNIWADKIEKRRKGLCQENAPGPGEPDLFR